MSSRRENDVDGTHSRRVARGQGHRAGRPGGRAVRRQSVRPVRGRGHQDRSAWRGRSAAAVAQASQRHIALVVLAESQQEIADAEPQVRERAKGGTRPGEGRRRARRKLPPGHARGMGTGLGRALDDQLAPGHGAHLRVRADRALPRPAGIRGDRGGDGRPALRDRLPRPRAGQGGREHRRYAGVALRGRGGAHRACDIATSTAARVRWSTSRSTRRSLP